MNTNLFDGPNLEQSSKITKLSLFVDPSQKKAPSALIVLGKKDSSNIDFGFLATAETTPQTPRMPPNRPYSRHSLCSRRR